MTTMARHPVDELIDAAQETLEELRVAVAAAIEASAEHQASAEEFTQVARQITHPEET